MELDAPTTLIESANAVLLAEDPGDKVRCANHAQELAENGAPLGLSTAGAPPTRPARPQRPVLAPPTTMPKRRLGSLEGRIALLHAIAHIEFNAIDLAFDMASRFAGDCQRLGLDAGAFVQDWFAVGSDEARHFTMIERRLGQLGAAYGDLPAHDGLWEAAHATAENFGARLAIAPLILEARGLDVTPGMIEKLRAAGDDDSAATLQIIYDEEIGHVACGKRWFDHVCCAKGEEPAHFFHKNRQQYFAGALKPPFNHEARAKAGLPISFYEPN